MLSPFHVVPFPFFSPFLIKNLIFYRQPHAQSMPHTYNIITHSLLERENNSLAFFAMSYHAIPYHVSYAILSIPSIQQTARSVKKNRPLCDYD